MSRHFYSFSTVIGISAFVIASASFYMQFSSSPSAEQEKWKNTESNLSVMPSIVSSQGQSQINVQQLQATLNELNNRIAQLESRIAQGQVSEESITQVIDAYVTKKEQEDKAKRMEQNPFHSFYENLPEDYEQRLKTDPEYAARIRGELRSKILDSNLTDEERLQAMAQLQMTSGILADFTSLENSTELSDAVMQIVNNTNDEKTRIRALETVTSGPINNPKLSSTFVNLMHNDSNSYVRNLAANGLGMLMYSRKIDNNTRQRLANNIVNTMRTTSDNKLRQILEQNFGTEQDIAEMLKHMQDQTPG